MSSFFHFIDLIPLAQADCFSRKIFFLNLIISLLLRNDAYAWLPFYKSSGQAFAMTRALGSFLILAIVFFLFVLRHGEHSILNRNIEFHFCS